MSNYLWKVNLNVVSPGSMLVSQRELEYQWGGEGRGEVRWCPLIEVKRR